MILDLPSGSDMSDLEEFSDDDDIEIPEKIQTGSVSDSDSEEYEEEEETISANDSDSQNILPDR